MPRELRMSVAVPLPDDAFAQADIIAATKVEATAFIESLRKTTKLDLDLTSTIVTQRTRGKEETEKPAAAVKEPEPVADLDQSQAGPRPVRGDRHPRAA